MRLGYIKLNLVIVVNRNKKIHLSVHYYENYADVPLFTDESFTWNLSKICSDVASGV